MQNFVTVKELQLIADRASDVDDDVRAIKTYSGRDGHPIAFRLAIHSGTLLRIGVAAAIILGEERATALVDTACMDTLGGYQTVWFDGWAVA